MFSKNLIVAGILAANLAANLASANVPLSVQHDATNSLAESVGISSTRNLRTMTEQTALGATAVLDFLCDNIGNEGGILANRNQLLDLDVIASIGVGSAQECCNACVNNDLCIAFNFQPLLLLESCLLARSREGLLGGLLNLNAVVDLDILNL